MEPLFNRPCMFRVVLIFLGMVVTADHKVIYVDADAGGASDGDRSIVRASKGTPHGNRTLRLDASGRR